MSHRTVHPSSVEIVPLKAPFSNFLFVEKRFGDIPSIRRLFSLSRIHSCETLVYEQIPPKGVVKDENSEIRARYPDAEEGKLVRLSFWKPAFVQKRKLESLTSEDLAGYAIVKQDIVPSKNCNRWHVFESVFQKYPDEHNCVSGEQSYRVGVDGHAFDISGVLYCQQNQLNKCCAHVALRSLCSLHVPDTELPYSRLNQLAEAAGGAFDPAKGLSVERIRAVLSGLDIRFQDVDYPREVAVSKDARNQLPYQKFLYAGVESGGGALLGFQLTGPEAPNVSHIIPFYGHTFNQDTWVPNANLAYFRIGEKTRYIPSESWLSSFIGHDDNFGSNFCVPKLYANPDQVQYVVELFRSGFMYSGVLAEAVAVNYLYSLVDDLGDEDNIWIRRLMVYSDKDHQQAVLRAIALSRAEYVDHLRSMIDWAKKRENRRLCNIFEQTLPEYLWVVEVSLPELFPANLRKLGEIALDASQPLSTDQDFSSFVLARFPGLIMLYQGKDGRKPQFLHVESKMTKHTPLYRF